MNLTLLFTIHRNPLKVKSENEQGAFYTLLFAKQSRFVGLRGLATYPHRRGGSGGGESTTLQGHVRPARDLRLKHGIDFIIFFSETGYRVYQCLF